MMSIPVNIRPTFISKITTALQLSTVLMVLYTRSMPDSFNEVWHTALFWLTALLTIISGLDYMMRGQKLMNQDIKK